MKISIPHLAKYLLGDLLDYAYNVVMFCRQRQPSPSPIDPQVDAVQNAAEALNKNFKLEQANEHSGRLAVLDMERYRLIVGFRTTTEGLTYHFDSNTSSAAVQVLAAIDKYGGIARLPYEAESVSINSLLNDLATNAALISALETLHLMSWIDQLRLVNNQFQEVYLTRVGNVTDTKHTPTTELRAGLVQAIRDLNSHLSAHAILHPDAALNALITDINTLTARHNQIADHRTSRNKKTAEQTAANASGSQD
ncbi:hypothetical protein LX69_00393 [Breznakibacter xylanolyticus]|uniref:Uncharacterized protein n=1 Tax=Breznakibacter xylanolyticus TaxID=990 RepID=A0A2W7NJ00_9BACT|nr:DUF6261 family protein [Breznakibacter xylanolyticus]PZX20395.1 hypothetical protein LX69_00393 [Breznakibacter xylanolyticus]